MSANAIPVGYYRSYHWIYGPRAEMLTISNHTCLRCGKEGGVDVHHRTYYHEDGDPVFWREEPRHLMVLCRGCHRNYHEIERAFFRAWDNEEIWYREKNDPDKAA